MLQIVCDLCGKEIGDRESFCRYRVEKRRWRRYFGWINEGYIDCHDDCVQLLAEMIEKKKSEETA